MQIKSFLDANKIDTTNRVRAVADVRMMFGDSMYDADQKQVVRAFKDALDIRYVPTTPVVGVQILQKIVHDSFDTGFEVDVGASLTAAEFHISKITTPSNPKVVERAPKKKGRGIGDSVKSMMQELIIDSAQPMNNKEFKAHVTKQLEITTACASTMIYNARKSFGL